MMTCREVTIHTVCNLVMELYAFLNCIDAVMVSVIDRGFEPWTWCCNSQCDSLECGRLWIRAPVWSNQRL